MDNRKKTGILGIALYATAMNFSIRWLANGAATGPVSITLWIIAALLFCLPLVCATLELSARYPEEGAIYAWTRETQGPFAGFLCGWLYWACNLPYFASLLFLIVNLAGSALKSVPGGEGIGNVMTTSWGAFIAATAILLGIAAMHARGFGTGKWLSIISASVSIALLLFLVWTGIHLTGRDGSATNFAAATYVPPFNSQGAILFSTIVFAYGGVEGAALMRNEARRGVKTLVPALILLGAFMALAYAGGTAAMLSIMPQDKASNLGGLPDALALALDRLHGSQWLPYVLLATALTFLGGMSAWFGAAARLPFAVGVDRMLPKAVGYMDPKTGAPTVAILIQAVLVIGIMALSAAGATLAGAYDFVVQMGVLTFIIPYLWMFAAYWLAQKKVMALDWRTPGGAAGARLLAVVGFVVVLLASLFSLLPSPSSEHPMQDFIKLVAASLVMIGIGAAIYGVNKLRKGKAA